MRQWMLIDDTLAISPIDGRYKQKTSSLRTHFSEAALISSRIKIELLYLRFLAKYEVIAPLEKKELVALDQLSKPSQEAVARVKEIEEKTHHDVKAVEYYLREQFESKGLKRLISHLHFAITSEDVNNLAYRLMLSGGLREVIWPSLIAVLENLNSLSKKYVALPMLARTHGQAAIPTTFGKELAVFSARLLPLLTEIKEVKLHGKFSGAVGGYQAMYLAHPQVNWPELSRELVSELGFELVEVTTQIAPADDLVKVFSIFQRLNSILLDLNQDIWRYISDGWLVQLGKEQFVGSSTMPQKINPIEFENSEGNLVMANAMLEGMMRKLPISRLQRDLSESTVLRNMGSVFAYCLLAYQSLSGGLAKLSADEKAMQQALEANYNILTEAWQTIARRNGDTLAYEKIAKLAKNKILTKADWQELSKGMGQELEQLNPHNYLGLSVQLGAQTIAKTKKFIKENSQLLTKKTK
jgi:adenylosuccinate lyase